MLHTALLCLLLSEDLHIRSTGTIRAVHVSNVLVPTIKGTAVKLTVTRIIPNGTLVHEGDILAEFDRTQQFDDARDAKAKNGRSGTSIGTTEGAISQRRGETRVRFEGRGGGAREGRD
jgi:multidrug efflux pump subunit AcrA (membrane-fusion protein)